MLLTVLGLIWDIVGVVILAVAILSLRKRDIEWAQTWDGIGALAEALKPQFDWKNTPINPEPAGNSDENINLRDCLAGHLLAVHVTIRRVWYGNDHGAFT